MMPCPLKRPALIPWPSKKREDLSVISMHFVNYQMKQFYIFKCIKIKNILQNFSTKIGLKTYKFKFYLNLKL